MYPGDRVAQLHRQVKDSISIAFYNSQDYGGGILTRLHMWSNAKIQDDLNYCRGVSVLYDLVTGNKKIKLITEYESVTNQDKAIRRHVQRFQIELFELQFYIP
jgi:hypothetical protein